ncbi:breast cancer type 2 susceptibility protein homolog isoform X2 [Drosophila takahashii]|uniref:breast cancer type 2 susceptibility protein homolog isoform X2 n=1 Tax=Drosophila takahashii TaxID=29030 RepID=UPI00389962A3
MAESDSKEVVIEEIDSNDVPENELEQFQDTDPLRAVDIIDCDADGGESRSFVADKKEGALIKRYVQGVQCLEFPDFCTKLEASDEDEEKPLEAPTASGNVEMPSTSAQAKPAQKQSSGSGRSGGGGGFRKSQLRTALQGLMGEADQDEVPAPVNEPGNGGLSGNIMAEVVNLYQADRQNSLRVGRNQDHSRSVFDNSDFVPLEYLILAQSSPTHEEVVENIRHDFCSSPTYVEDEDEHPCESPPWFRFRKKTIKTYSRKRFPDKEDLRLIVGNEVQDRPSCSSGLSVQEDLNTTSTSASTASGPNIDLPSKARQDSERPSCSRESPNGLLDTNSSSECTYTEIEKLNDELQNVFQICSFKPQGTFGDNLFGDTMQTTIISHSRLDIKYEDWFETDSYVEDYSTEKITLNVKSKPKTISVELDNIPINEWLIEMDVPENSVEEYKESPLRKTPEEEEFVGFRTASDKPIQVSEDMQKRAEKCLAECKAAETHQPKIEDDHKDSADDIFFSADEDSNDTIFLSQINPNKLEYRDDSVITECKRKMNSPQQNPPQRNKSKSVRI